MLRSPNGIGRCGGDDKIAAMSTQVGPTGAETLVNSLAAEGADTIFGLPGLQLDYIFDALYGRQDAIRVIHTRHEQATAYMAFGYAQASGRIGTCLVVPGPGVLNATAALSTAYACNAPVLCITGQIPSAHIGGGLGFLHEIPDQTRLLASVSKWQGLVKSPAHAADIVHAAFRELNGGRRRPVVIEIPPDVAAARSTAAAARGPAEAVGAVQPDPEAIARAAALLGRARNPAIFAGSGAFGAESELRQLAEMLQAPVIMSEHGLGALDIRHPLAQTMQVGNDLWPRIDVALAVGTRFFHPIVEWGRDDDVRLIRIDIDPEQSIAAWRPDVHIVADARAA
jgi:acetolactate synthase I/II/III large subunit